jgi:hypothetical protein
MAAAHVDDTECLSPCLLVEVCIWPFTNARKIVAVVVSKPCLLHT